MSESSGDGERYAPPENLNGPIIGRRNRLNAAIVAATEAGALLLSSFAVHAVAEHVNPTDVTGAEQAKVLMVDAFGPLARRIATTSPRDDTDTRITAEEGP
jgi:hypothetical protein